MNLPLINPRYHLNLGLFRCINNAPNSPTGILECVNSMSPINEFSSEKIKKSVSFQTMAEVILIASRQEYFDAGLASSIWYSKKDRYNFKKNFIDELQLFKMNNPEISPKDALRKMIEQSSELEVNENQPQNFLCRKG